MSNAADPITLHQVRAAFGSAYEPGELAAAAVRLVRNRVLERRQVPSYTGIGRRMIYAYLPGVRFDEARQRNPRIIAKLRAHMAASALARHRDSSGPLDGVRARQGDCSDLSKRGSDAARQDDGVRHGA